MKKDVIYIDIEDDITSIIEKVKAAKADIVALVPPKRIGTLQSVVNLKLLQRGAKAAGKRPVLITSDAALTSLAAGVSMPVAKNLQSKPEIPEIAALDIDEEDIINGDELPVGELAGTVPTTASTTTPAAEAAAKPVVAPSTTAAPLAASAAANAPKKKSGVPNFEMFRKKLFLLGGGGVLLVIFLIWAIFFAGHATIAITAKTNIVNISKSLQLTATGKLDVDQSVIPAIVQQTKKTNSVDFTPTGQKNIGKAATGTVEFTNGSQPSAVTVAAGTKLATTGGLVFTTDGSVTVPGVTLSCSPAPCHVVPGTADSSVTAVEPGAKYNGATGSMTGAPSGLTAALSGATSGGTDNTVTVVSQGDIDKAKDQLKSQDASSVKTELQKQFDADTTIIINESFLATPGTPTSTPAVDQQATTAKLTAETTYSLVGIKRADLKAIYDSYLKAQIAGDPTQKVYESGDSATQFSQFSQSGDNYTVTASAVAQVGPNIDETAIKKQSEGKRAGEIQQAIDSIQGVEDVQTSFSPFWVTKAPSNPNRITIKFVLKHDN